MSDVDLSYLHMAQSMMDITYYLEITPRYLKGAAINLEQSYLKNGVFNADIYHELKRFDKFVDLSKVRLVNTCGRYWFLKAFLTNLKLRRELKSKKFDVIHISWPLNFYELMLYSLRSKMVVTFHDPIQHSNNSTMMANIRRWLALHFLNNFIILNKNQKNDFIKNYGLQRKNVFVSRLSRYSYLQAIVSHKKAVEDRSILFFGKIASYKGLEFLFPAFEKVHTKHPDVSLIVAGNGEYYFDISDYRQKSYFKILNRFIPDDELAELIRDTEFSVIPYKDGTQSGVAMSAFAFNKPVLATKVGGLPEMLGYGKYGMLIEPSNVDSLSEAICKMLDNPNLVQQYTNNIKHDYIEGTNSWENVCNEHINIYKTVVSTNQND